MRGGAKYTKKRRLNKRKLTRRRNLRNKRKVMRGGYKCEPTCPLSEGNTTHDYDDKGICINCACSRYD